VSDAVIAQMLVDLLISKGVPARVAGDTVLLGMKRECRILVPDDFLRRARLFVPPAYLIGGDSGSLATEPAGDEGEDEDDDPVER